MKDLKELAKELGFKALAANWNDFAAEPCIKKLLELEEED